MKTIIPIIHLYSILKNTVGIIFENFLICSWKAIHMRIIDLKIGNGKVLSRSSSLVGYFILVFPVMGKNKNGGLFFIENIYMFVLKNYLINSSYQIVWSGFQSNSVISIKKIVILSCWLMSITNFLFASIIASFGVQEPERINMMKLKRYSTFMRLLLIRKYWILHSHLLLHWL